MTSTSAHATQLPLVIVTARRNLAMKIETDFQLNAGIEIHHYSDMVQLPTGQLAEFDGHTETTTDGRVVAGTGGNIHHRNIPWRGVDGLANEKDSYKVGSKAAFEAQNDKLARIEGARPMYSNIGRVGRNPDGPFGHTDPLYTMIP